MVQQGCGKKKKATIQSNGSVRTMVPAASEDKERLYECLVCGLHYIRKEWAEQCEAWCKKHHSCSLAITSHAEERNSAR